MTNSDLPAHLRPLAPWLTVTENTVELTRTTFARGDRQVTVVPVPPVAPPAFWEDIQVLLDTHETAGGVVHHSIVPATPARGATSLLRRRLLAGAIPLALYFADEAGLVGLEHGLIQRETWERRDIAARAYYALMPVKVLLVAAVMNKLLRATPGDSPTRARLHRSFLHSSLSVPTPDALHRLDPASVDAAALAAATVRERPVIVLHSARRCAALASALERNGFTPVASEQATLYDAAFLEAAGVPFAEITRRARRA
jgi:hypothetical protein